MSPPTLFVLSRADWGADPVVRSSGGQPRPALARPATWLTVHYTGNSTALFTKDRAAVIAAQQGLERFAAQAGKPNEYNWSLFADAAGVGYIVEYAGGYRAAHSEGENDRAVGVLFWVAVDQPVPDAMVNAYRYLRDTILVPGGAVGPATSQTPHRSMPGAATPCPGPVLDRWAELLEPYKNGGDPMPATLLVRNGDDPTGAKDKNWNAYRVGDTSKCWVPTNEALAIAIAELGQPVDVTDEWMRAHGPVIGQNPGADEWGAWTAVKL